MYLSRRDFLKSTAALGAVFGASFALSACAKDEASTTGSSLSDVKIDESEVLKTDDVVETVQQEGKYPKVVVAVAAAPSSLDPVDSTTNTGADYVYEKLYDTIGAEIVPCLAKSVTEVDETHYQYEIYDNVYDTDGNNLTAQDIVDCYNYFVESGKASKFDIYDSCKAVGDYVIEFTWKEPINKIGATDKILGTPVYCTAARESHNFPTDMCGTGPYALSSSTSGSSLVFEARDDYWGDGNENRNVLHYANVQTLQLDVLVEAAQNVIALTEGKVDISANIPDINVADFADGGQYADEFNTIAQLGHDSVFVACNMKGGPSGFGADVNFRKAVFYAIDNKTVADIAGNCLYATSMGGHLGMGGQADHVASWCEEENYVTVYDPELAKEYLAKTDYKGEEIIMITQSNEQYENALVMIQSMLQAIGIKSKVSPLENNIYRTARNGGEFDIMLAMFGGPKLSDAMNLLCGWQEHGGHMNHSDSQELYDLYQACTLKETAGAESLTNLYHYMLDTASYYFLWTNYSTIVYRNIISAPFVQNGAIQPQACEYVQE